MPMYQYRCTECQHEFTLVLPIAKMDEPEESVCAGCGRFETIRHVIGAPVIGYHHQGWMKPTTSFQDRLKDMKKKHGKDNTIGNAIR